MNAIIPHAGSFVKNMGIGAIAHLIGGGNFAVGLDYAVTSMGWKKPIEKAVEQAGLYFNNQTFPIPSAPLPALSLLTCPKSTSPFYNAVKWFDHQKHLVPFRCPLEHPLDTISQVVAYDVIEPAIKEELLFRGLIQEVLLKRLPEYVLKIALPGKEMLLETKAARAFRIGLTAVLFSASHLLNGGLMSAERVASQIVQTMGGGLVIGILKEKWGLAAALGAHIFNNLGGRALQIAHQVGIYSQCNDPTSLVYRP